VHERVHEPARVTSYTRTMVVESSTLGLKLAGTAAVAGLVHDHGHLPPPGQICYSHLHSSQTTQLEL